MNDFDDSIIFSLSGATYTTEGSHCTLFLFFDSLVMALVDIHEIFTLEVVIDSIIL